MNIEEARNNLECLAYEDNLREYQEKAYEALYVFIDEVEEVLKNNSIKQTPALFKEKK